MPTFSLVRPDGTRCRLTAPQWAFVRDLVAWLERRPTCEAFLAWDLLPLCTGARGLGHVSNWLDLLSELGVLERTPRGFHLPARIRAQVASADARTSA